VYRPTPRLTRLFASLLPVSLAYALAVSSVGCGGDKHVTPIVIPPPLPAGTPENTSPDSTVRRLMTAYQYEAPVEYDTLLTADFHYQFSAQTDPALAALYGNAWGKPNEGRSFVHLTTGFTNSGGTYVPKASSITASLVNDVVGNDTTHADSTTWYRAVSVAALNINIDVLTGSGSTTYNISSPMVFLLVRGDVAVLSAGQSHSASRWYVREMDDLTPTPFSKFPQTMPARTSTWGSVRANYL